VPWRDCRYRDDEVGSIARAVITINVAISLVRTRHAGAWKELRHEAKA